MDTAIHDGLAQREGGLASTIEEHYQPYILEFGALRYNLDKLSNITWGFQLIELETDR